MAGIFILTVKYNLLTERRVWAEIYFDLTEENFVDDIEEAKARIESVARKIIAENIEEVW